MRAVFHHWQKSFIVLLATCLLSTAAMARLTVTVNGRQMDVSRAGLSFVYDSSHQHDFERWLQVNHLAQPITGENLNMSYRNGMFWVLVDLAMIPIKDSAYYIQLRNPHINFLGAWLVEGDKIIRSFPLTGDHLPFDTRNISHTQFVYKLGNVRAGQKLLLMIDKRNEQLHLPVGFYSEESLHKSQHKTNLLAGLFTGISLFILLFTIFLYLNMRERLYIYYTLYVLMVMGYIFSDLGLSFMYLYPNTPSLADFARPLTISLAPIFYILFSRSLLGVKEHFPRLFKITNYHLYFFAFCFALGFGIPSAGPLRTFWLVLMQVIMVTSIIPVFIFSIAGFRKGIRYSGYIILASVLFTVFSQVYMQYITGNLPESFFTRNAFYIGFSTEIILLTLALSIRFKSYKLEAEGLLMQLNRQQENIFKNISQYQEQEMTRLSGMLHDTIGAGLSSIKYNLEAVQGRGKEDRLLESTIEDVSTLTDEIRSISHNLSPLLLQQKGLLRALETLIERYNRTSKVHIWLESIGSRQSSSFQNEILVFRIVQELLNNAMKHSAATEIIIQLIIEEELISILVEDNGKGILENRIKEGLGFAQIKALVTFVQGRFHVESAVNKGCSISVEFPTIPHDSSDKSTIGRRSPYVS